MDEKIVSFVQTIVIPKYWDCKGGRGSRHFNDVLRAATRLVGRELDNREYLACALHDIGVGLLRKEDRNLHGRKAVETIMQNEDFLPVRDMVDKEILDAVEKHMSFSYNVTGILSPIHQLLVEADEGEPVWGTLRIEKPVKYWLNGRNEDQPLSTPLPEVVKHIRGVLHKKVISFRSGIAPFTARYCKVFEKEIEQAIAWEATVTDKDVYDVIAKLRG